MTRYGHDESMGLIFDGNEPLTMAEVAKRLNAMQGVIDRLDNEIEMVEAAKEFARPEYREQMQGVVENLKYIKCPIPEQQIT